MSEETLQISDRFPRVAKAIRVFWGYKELRPYINSLLADARGDRQGFPPDVVIYLMNLLDEHDKEFPEFKPSEEGWASTFY